MAVEQAFLLDLILLKLTDIFSSLAVHPADAWTIAHERADCRELSNKTYDWQLVPLRKRDNLLTAIQHDWIGCRDQRLGFGIQQLLKREFELAGARGIERDGFYAELPCSSDGVRLFDFDIRVGRDSSAVQRGKSSALLP